MNLPVFWKTTLAEIDEAYGSACKVAEKRILARSPGGRPVYMLAYGAKKLPGTANYSSALGSHDASCYNNPANDHPTIVLIGAEHGQETEGVAALMNLIALLETGKDLAGNGNDALLALAEKARIVIVPVANPDGRARVQPAGMVGLTGYDLRYWGQGTWKDGSLCGWPECKKVHPIKGHEDFLGGYYNDNGINLMHDNFFHPYAAETQSLLDLCADEAADFVLHLHGGSNSMGDLLQTNYVPLDVQQAIVELSKRCLAVGLKENLEFNVIPVPERESGANPPSFNLVSAVHHVCGGVSVCYESNECLIDEPGPHRTHEEITRMHMILFEETLRMALE